MSLILVKLSKVNRIINEFRILTTRPPKSLKGRRAVLVLRFATVSLSVGGRPSPVRLGVSWQHLDASVDDRRAAVTGDGQPAAEAGETTADHVSKHLSEVNI